MFPPGSSGSAPAWKATTLIPLNASLRSANSNSTQGSGSTGEASASICICPWAAVKYPGIGRFAYAGGHLGNGGPLFVLAFLAALYEMSRETLMSAVTFMAPAQPLRSPLDASKTSGKAFGAWAYRPEPPRRRHRHITDAKTHTRWRKERANRPGAPRPAGPPWACPGSQEHGTAKTTFGTSNSVFRTWKRFSS